SGFLRAFVPFLIRLTPILLATRSRFWVVEDLPPLLWTALWGRLRGARVIYDAREIILETPAIRSRPLRRFLWGMWHAAGVRLADAVVCVSPLAQAHYRRLLPGKPVGLLPNAPMRRAGGAAAALPSSSRAAPAGEVRLLYQGSLRPGSGLKEALRALVSAPRYRLDIYGFGPEEGALRALASDPRLAGRVRFGGTVPFEALPALVAEAHVGLHLLRPDGLSFDLTLSNKIFDYLHGETPMLLGPTAAHRDFLARHPVGVAVGDLSEAAILAGLAELEAGWEGFRAACREARAIWTWEAFEETLVGPGGRSAAAVSP
ncbi:MAG TPA: hypothetical protein VK465_17220, partial [Fibrobacteria bacterium]|nr:hypothetical protein [Fibrobacteria bacterium]